MCMKYDNLFLHNFLNGVEEWENRIKIIRGSEVSKANWNYCGHSMLRVGFLKHVAMVKVFIYLQHDKESNVDLNFKYSIDLCCVKCSKMTLTRTHKNSSINYIGRSTFFPLRRKVWKTWEFYSYEKIAALQILWKKINSSLYKHWNAHILSL